MRGARQSFGHGKLAGIFIWKEACKGSVKESISH